MRMRSGTFVFFPSGAVPNSPRETLDEKFRCAIALCGTCHADTVYEKGDKGETRWEDENDDESEYGAR